MKSRISLARTAALRYREEKMRRILSMFLLLFLALPLVAPAFGQTAQQKLLLCCRKGGAHHCITSATTEDGLPVPALRAHCPATPNPAATGHATDGISDSADQTSISAPIGLLRIREVEAGYCVSSYRSRQKRGPPAFLFS